MIDDLSDIPPKFNSLPLKNDGWKITFLLGWLIFRGYVKLPGGSFSEWHAGISWIPCPKLKQTLSCLAKSRVVYLWSIKIFFC